MLRSKDFQRSWWVLYLDEEAEEGYEDTKVQGNEHMADDLECEILVEHLNGDIQSLYCQMGLEIRRKGFEIEMWESLVHL